jgi:hypothetical protein
MLIKEKNMKNIASLFLVIGVLTNCFFMESAYAQSQPSQNRNSRDYPQITRSSICGINVILPNQGKTISFLDFVIRNGIKIVSMPTGRSISVDDLRESCSRPMTVGFERERYGLGGFRVDVDLRISQLDNQSSLTIACNQRDRESNFNPHNVPGTIREHCQRRE